MGFKELLTKYYRTKLFATLLLFLFTIWIGMKITSSPAESSLGILIIGWMLALPGFLFALFAQLFHIRPPFLIMLLVGLVLVLYQFLLCSLLLHFVLKLAQGKN